MKLLGRRVMLSNLDPVPEGMRFAPDVVVLCTREFEQLFGPPNEESALFKALRQAADDYDRDFLRRKLAGAGV